MMTPTEFRDAKEALGVTWKRLAEVLGYSDGSHCRAIARGKVPVIPTTAILLRILLKVPAARRLVGL